MSKLSKQLTEVSENISLSADEKNLMRSQLLEYTKFKPIPTPARERGGRFSLPTFSFFRIHHLSGAFMIAVLVTSGSFGVSLAATGALPGDLLYPVKVGINEEVKTAFLDSAEARVDWERERAVLRLSEASQLAAEGKLDDERQEEVSRLFAEHTDAVTEQVLAIEETDPALAVEVSSEFETALNTQEAVLARLIVEKGDTPNDADRSLIGQVHTAAAKAGKAREGVEEKLADAIEETEETAPEEGEQNFEEEEQPVLVDSANMRVHLSYRARLRAEEHLRSAEELLAQFDPASDIAAQAKAQMISGKALVAEGDVLVENNDLSDAYSSYRRAGDVFQKVAELLEVANLFAIEIYPSATFEISEKQNSEEAATSNADSVNLLRSIAETAVHDAQSLMLTQEGYGAETVARANSLIKNAIANMLRAEIALVLGDFMGAEGLYKEAQKEANRAYDLLERAAAEENMREVGAVEEYVVEEQSKETVEEVVAENSEYTVDIASTYTDGVHVFSGSVEGGPQCSGVVASAFVAESYPEQITITLEHITEDACDENDTMYSFSLEVRASEAAELHAVQVDSVPVEWNSEKEGLLQRTFETAADPLLPN